MSKNSKMKSPPENQHEDWRDESTFLGVMDAFETAFKELASGRENLTDLVEELEEKNRRYEGILFGSRDAIFVIEGESGLIQYANEAAGEMTGRKSESLVDTHVMDLHPSNDQEAMQEAFEEVRETGSVAHLESTFKHKNGGTVPVSIAAHLLEDEKGDFVVGFVRDITPLKKADEDVRKANEELQKKIEAQQEAEEDLRQLNESLEERILERTDELEAANHELEIAARKSEELAEESRKASEAKSTYMANMTHELRTPLNAVIGMAELLQDMDLDEEQKESARTIAASGNHLLDVINDILDHARLDADKMDLHRLPFPLKDTLESMGETFAPQLKKKDLRFELSMDERLPEEVRGDQGRVRQVLMNLIGNAIKFTDRGSVAVQATMGADLGGKMKVEFSVTDTGIGIPEEKQDGLFLPYTQADPSIANEYGGSGLGLSISRELVRRMGGTISMESEPGWGSTFRFSVVFERTDAPVQEEKKAQDPDFEMHSDESWKEALATDPDQEGGLIVDREFDLEIETSNDWKHPEYEEEPVDAQEPEETEVTEEPEAEEFSEETEVVELEDEQDEEETEEETEEFRILLVEDNKVNQKVALGMLKKIGYSADPVADGEAALEALSEKDYDMVFLDVQMPGINGFEVARKIRDGEVGEETQDIPIVAMTANASRQDRQMCLESGMTDYLSKPVSSQRIAEVIDRVMESIEAMEEAEEPRLEERPFDKDELVEEFEGDQDLAEEILDLFMKDAGERLKVITGALHNYDFDFVNQEAKAVKGGAKNVHADIMVNLSSDLLQASLAKKQDQALEIVEEMKEELDQIGQKV